MHRLATLGAAILVAAGIGLAAGQAGAEAPAEETGWLTLEGYAALPMSAPHHRLFGRGGGGAIGLYHSLVPQLAFGLRLGAVVLSEEDTGQGPLGMGMLTGSMRIRPFAHLWPERRATGLWLEAGIGGGLIHDAPRLVFEAGIGINFPAGPVAFGPMARLVHVVESQPRFASTDRDIFIALFGVELAILDVVDPDPELPPIRPVAY